MPETQSHHPQQRYRVIEKLASGGMAEVFRAESAGLAGFKKQVAIKRVLPHLSEKKKFISMFLDEARLSARLSHSNCVQVFDIGVGDNTYFIVMEYVDGADLKAIIETLRKQGRDFPLEEAVFIAVKMCEGLAYAHELSDPDGHAMAVVHRDVSPPNVLITKYGEVKIVDFGLAKASIQLEKSEPGIIKGKFSYLSPEAAMGQELDSRSDIFAVGIILWEMLSGRRLFLGDTDYQTVKLVQAAQIPPLSKLNPKVPADLEAIVLKALAREPAHRFPAARDLAAALTEFLFRRGRPVGSFKIAELVLGAMVEKVRGRPPAGSIIEKLIQETLFEFTSLEAQEQEREREAGRASPVAGGGGIGLPSYEQVQDWASEIAVDVPALPRPAFPSGELQAGNLAALEDDEPLGGAGPVSRRGVAPPGRIASQPPPMGPAMRLPHPSAPVLVSQPPPPRKGSIGAVAIVVLLVVAAAAAGAYYTGLIPGLPPPH